MTDDSHSTPPDVLAREVARNLETRDAWELFAPHRAIVTDHLVRAGGADRSKTLCLLGAGNANDVDLRQLLNRYASIDLVDYDAKSLQAAVARQCVADDPRVRLHGGIDLAGASVPLPRTDYDVIASLCLLSQLMHQVAQLRPEDATQQLASIQAIRRCHLDSMLSHLRPGGFLLLVTDFLSSDTCPELLTVDDAQLAAAADRWIQSQNFFTGLNPHVLLEQLRAHESVATTQLVRPWRWQLSPRRAYAVCALKAFKR